MKPYLPFVALVVILALVIGCTPTEQPTPTDEATNKEEFIESLQEAGATVQSQEELEDSFLSVNSQRFTVNGEDVWVFEYVTEAARAEDQAKIDQTGSMITTPNGIVVIDYIAPPHFFSEDLIIVQYVGTNQAMLDLLTSVLGEEFTGMNSPTQTECSADQRNAEVCTEEYRPACGWFAENVQCFAYPCAQTFSNPCQACSNENIAYWTEGECPSVGGEEQPDFVLWETALEYLYDGEVTEVFQAHSLEVIMTLENGTQIRTIEPSIDNIFDEIRTCGTVCSSIAQATE